MSIPTKPLPKAEFVILMTCMAALDAIAIDTMLPALAQIASELGIERDNDRQLIVTSLFLGFACGLLVYGLIADSFGRKRPAYLGFGIYIIGTLLCVFAGNLEIMLAGRVVQGIGAAGPYVLSLAIVRDIYKGREMAGIVSIMMMVFVAIPAAGPLLGQGIILLAGWRTLFILLALVSAITLIWFAWRQPETLAPHKRPEFSPGQLLNAFFAVIKNRQTLGSTLALAALSGAFIAFLSTSQQIFQEQYGLGTAFPLYFCALAIALGFASFSNSRWVIKLGMVKLIWRALIATLCFSGCFLIYDIAAGGSPLAPFFVYMLVTYFCFGVVFGNFTSLALEPMGHIAGFASALIGALNIGIGMLLAVIIGGLYQGRVLPIVAGFAILTAIAMLLFYWATHDYQSPDDLPSDRADNISLA